MTQQQTGTVTMTVHGQTDATPEAVVSHLARAIRRPGPKPRAKMSRFAEAADDLAIAGIDRVEVALSLFGGDCNAMADAMSPETRAALLTAILNQMTAPDLEWCKMASGTLAFIRSRNMAYTLVAPKLDR